MTHQGDGLQNSGNFVNEALLHGKKGLSVVWYPKVLFFPFLFLHF